MSDLSRPGIADDLLEHRLTVLIADDDAGYRFPLVNLFRDAGFKVIEAEDRRGLTSRAAGTDVWIVDVRLPEGTIEGVLAVRDLAATDIRPNHMVVFVSAYPRDFAAAALDELQTRGVPFMWFEKPFELESILESVLDDARQRETNASSRSAGDHS